MHVHKTQGVPHQLPASVSSSTARCASSGSSYSTRACRCVCTHSCLSKRAHSSLSPIAIEIWCLLAGILQRPKYVCKADGQVAAPCPRHRCAAQYTSAAQHAHDTTAKSWPKKLATMQQHAPYCNTPCGNSQSMQLALYKERERFLLMLVAAGHSCWGCCTPSSLLHRCKAGQRQQNCQAERRAHFLKAS